MTALMKFAPGLAFAGFADLAFQLMSGARPPSAMWSRLIAAMFRDSGGHYWTPGICSRRWFRWDGARWEILAPPTQALEAPVTFAACLPGAGALEPQEVPSSGSATPGQHPNGAAALEAFVAGVMADYDQGFYSSTDADNLLRSNYVPDLSGTIWTLGCHSRRWYAWRQHAWRPEQEPPLPDILPIRWEQLQQVSEQVQCRLLIIFASDAPVPETVAFPWHPPASLPEIPRFCTACRAANPIDSVFCRLCGASSDQLISDPEVFLNPGRAAQPEGRSCPSCGAAAAPTLKFCTRCGTRLG